MYTNKCHILLFYIGINMLKANKHTRLKVLQKRIQLKYISFRLKFAFK